MLDHVDEISKPKVIEGYIPPREMPIPVDKSLFCFVRNNLYFFFFQIKKEALTYEMTEGMASLAGKIPDRFKMKPEPEHPPGYVNPTALKYKSELYKKLCIFIKHFRCDCFYYYCFLNIL